MALRKKTLVTLKSPDTMSSEHVSLLSCLKGAIAKEQHVSLRGEKWGEDTQSALGSHSPPVEKLPQTQGLVHVFP